MVDGGPGERVPEGHLTLVEPDHAGGHGLEQRVPGRVGVRAGPEHGGRFGVPGRCRQQQHVALHVRQTGRRVVEELPLPFAERQRIGQRGGAVEVARGQRGG